MNKHHIVMMDAVKRLDFFLARLQELREQNDSVLLTQTESFVIRGRIEEVKLMIQKEKDKDEPYREDASYA